MHSNAIHQAVNAVARHFERRFINDLSLRSEVSVEKVFPGGVLYRIITDTSETDPSADLSSNLVNIATHLGFQFVMVHVKVVGSSIDLAKLDEDVFNVVAVFDEGIVEFFTLIDMNKSDNPAA